MEQYFKALKLFLLLFIGIITMSSTPTVYFIDDSTMADYDPAVYPSQRGWGQMFHNFMLGDINFVNWARNDEKFGDLSDTECIHPKPVV